MDRGTSTLKSVQYFQICAALRIDVHVDYFMTLINSGNPYCNRFRVDCNLTNITDWDNNNNEIDLIIVMMMMMMAW